MIKNYLNETDFTSYEDMKENLRITCPDDFNFAFDVMDRWANEQPAKRAMIWCDDHGTRIDYSFSDLKRLTDKTANALVSLGIARGDVVMFMLKQRVEAWTCMLAMHKIGAICIPATHQLTKKDIEYRCNAAGVKMVITVDDPELVAYVQESLPQCPSVKTYAVVGRSIPDGAVDLRSSIEKASEAFQRPQGDDRNRASDPMLIYFSSGTTGMPKMVLHNYTYPLAHIVTAHFWHQVKDGDISLTMSDSGWGKFAWGKLYGQWFCGATVVAYDSERFHPVKLLELMQELQINVFCAPPTIYRFLIKEDMAKYNFSSLRHASVAGEPLNPEVVYQFEKFTGVAPAEAYGQTETTVLVGNFKGMPIKVGSVGKPSPLYNVDIVDENGKTCPPREVGSIVIRGVYDHHPIGLFCEYYRDSQATEDACKGNMYNTGDTAWYDEDGYIWFEGRNDDVIKCSGYRIGPYEVESAVLTHPAALECAVTAVPHPTRGQVVKATIVLVKGVEPSEALKKEIQEHVKHITAPYKYPRVIEFVDELPKTISGKIRRVEIREHDKKKQ